MAQSFALQPLLDIMQTRSDEATRKLGQLIAAEQNQRSRLNMLEQYRGEYAERMRAAGLQGVARPVLANYRSFLARIDEAIAQQQREVEISEQSTRAGQENWQAQNKQLKAIDALAKRHSERERQRENKQEQKIQDEFSTRKFSTPDPADT